MNAKRKLNLVYAPPVQQGFLGTGHVARPVIQIDFSQSDPFIMLMDDWLDKKDNVPVGGPHPHAGFETVSLLLEGEFGDESHTMRRGDFEMMTAGSGVVHTEIISAPTKMRLLQLWLNLPKQERHALPRIQKLFFDHVPKTSADGFYVNLYSGSFAGITSPVKNHTPIIIADVTMESDVYSVQKLPANFTTFLYMTEGVVRIGEEEKLLSKNEVGWLDRGDEDGESELIMKAGPEGAKFVIYSAEPQYHEIVSHGPFIADSSEDIQKLYAEYRQGKMKHISKVGEAQRFVY